MSSTIRPSSTARMTELFGQTVVVIGGSAGIVLETARRAKADGARLILTARNPERLKFAASDVEALRQSWSWRVSQEACLRTLGNILKTRHHIRHTLLSQTCGP